MTTKFAVIVAISFLTPFLDSTLTLRTTILLHFCADWRQSLKSRCGLYFRSRTATEQHDSKMCAVFGQQPDTITRNVDFLEAC